MRNVLVTGGSRGLGLGIAKKLANSGYRVIALARKPTRDLADAIAEVERREQGALSFIGFDLGDTEHVPQLLRSLRVQFGPLFGLINNAALGHAGVLANMRGAQIEELVRVNTLAPIMLTKYAVRGMMAQGAGRIVNITSIIGYTGYTGLSAYAATKASMIGFTRSLAREVGQLGITVNAVAPGFLATDMTHELADGQRQRIIGRSALRRLAEVEDVAAAVEYLLGEHGRNITGTVMTIDAGATA